jgi:hypothetical protein
MENKVSCGFYRIDWLSKDTRSLSWPKVQAKKGVLYRGGSVFQRAPRERLTQKGNAKVMKLYDRLRKRVLTVLRKQGQNGIAVRIGAMT